VYTSGKIGPPVLIQVPYDMPNLPRRPKYITTYLYLGQNDRESVSMVNSAESRSLVTDRENYVRHIPAGELLLYIVISLPKVVYTLCLKLHACMLVGIDF